jgi:hypothetical protein
MKPPLFCSLFGLFFSLAIFAQDTTCSYFMQMIWLKGDGRVRPVLFPNDSIAVFFFGENKDTIPVDAVPGKEFALRDKSALIFHDSMVSANRGKLSVWECRFGLAVDGPHFVGICFKNKRTNQWSSFKIFCGLPYDFGLAERPVLKEFKYGEVTELNVVSYSSPGMPFSRKEAIGIAKKNNYYKEGSGWSIEDIRYFNDKRCWQIISYKTRTSYRGKCKHCNGCTIVHDCRIVISAENGSVVYKGKSRMKVKNYE